MAAADGSAAPDLGVVDQPQPNGDEPPEQESLKPEVTPSLEERVEVAKVETEGGEIKVVYRIGEDDPNPLEFTLKAEPPASFLPRLDVLRDDDHEGTFRLIESLIGREQFHKVMDKWDVEGRSASDETTMTSLGEFVNRAVEKYGTTLGESQASPKS